ncbi:MAG TPA: universal stress protein [Solirubrobacteraceae bacterium]|nr:universal stress protein [Solirubrobacteraceae bacterium]
MSTETQRSPSTQSAPRIQRIAAAVDDRLEGRDAAVLVRELAAATGAEPMLIAIEHDIAMLLPLADWDAIRRDTMRMLHRLRDELVPGARTAAGRDTSIVRGLEQIVARDHRQLLVLGSSRRGLDQKVSIGHTTRQLINDLACPLAVAPRGLSTRPEFALRRIAVGFDGGPHAAAALVIGQQLAQGAGAELHVLGAVDDRIPWPTWAEMWLQPFRDEWREAIDGQVADLEHTIDAAVADVRVTVYPQVVRDVPSKALTAMSEQVDLVVIGSRRWGSAARLLLGGTGEALVRECRAPLLIVPAPAAA